MGIQINGATDSITAIDGTIDVVSAIGNAGVVTATAFVGNITGNVTGNINHASDLELQVGGVTRGKFDSSGRLLIGTTNPTAKLVVSNDGANGFEFNPNFNSNNSIIASYNRTGGGSYSQLTLSASQHIFAQGGTEYGRFDANGRLGIGTDNPTEDLHITGDTPVIRLEDSDTSRQSQIVGIDGNLRFDADNGNAQADTNISFRTDGSEKLRITSSGEVNIGGNYTQTTAPLCVTTGANSFGIRLQTGSNSVCNILNNDAAGSCEIRGYYNNNSGTQGEGFRLEANGETFFSPGGNAGLNITSNGNVVVSQTLFITDRIQHYGDNDTTIRFSGADTITAETGGVERVRITSGGKIGINQSGPFADVDITSSVEDTDNSSLAQHGIRLAHIGAANEEVIPITAGFVSQQNRARAGIGFISKTISGADGMGGAIGFYTRNTADGHALYRADERARITESGQFLVGATSSNGARAIIQQNSSDTNPLDQQTSADSSGLRIQNYSFGVGRYSALSLECASASQVQSASIISQSVSSGVSPDIIIAQRTSLGANSERLRINSDGYVVKGSGLTCAFNVSGTNMTRSNTAAYVCEFDDDSSSGHFDSGNNFNTSTHKFVAPVSGYYYFFTNIRLDSFNSGYIRTAILSTSYHAGTTYYTLPSTGHVITYADNGSIQTVQTSTVMYLPATHEAWVYQNPNSDTSYTVYLNESSFGGYFIG